MNNETKVKVVTADPSALGLFGLAIITLVASSQKLGLTSGVLIMTALSMVSNYYVIFPLYAKIIPMEAIIGMGRAVSEKVTDLWSFMVYCILPFNLLKGLITSALMMLVYKKLSPIFKLG